MSFEGFVQHLGPRNTREQKDLKIREQSQGTWNSNKDQRWLCRRAKDVGRNNLTKPGSLRKRNKKNNKE